MSVDIWIYTGAGFLVGVHVLWIFVTEIRLWNYAKSILHLEARARIAMEQISVTQRTFYNLDQRTAHLRGGGLVYRRKAKTKKGKRKR